MAAIINTTYPSYNNVGNYSGVNSVVRSAGVVRNTEHADALIGLEREGRLNLSQFGGIKLPRDVLFMQDERGAKIRATKDGDQVSSSSASDLDEERDLSKVDDKTDPFRKVDVIKSRKEKGANAGGQEAAAANVDKQAHDSKKLEETAHKDRVQKPEERKNQEFAAVFAENKSQSAPAEKKREEARPARLSLVGAPSTIYSTVQASAGHQAKSEDQEERPRLNVLA